MHRPFDGVMITLSAALLIVFGIVIGRFLVTSEAVKVVNHLDTELSTLRTELAEMSRNLVIAQGRVAALQESSDSYRQLAIQHQIRADRLAAREVVISQTVDRVAAERQTCRSELQEYVALNRPIPALDVLHFAEEMFDRHATTLQQLSADQETVVVALPSAPSLPSRGISSTPRRLSTSRQRSPPSGARTNTVAVTGPSLPPALPAPVMFAPETNKRSAPQRRGVYFAPPERQPQQRSHTFFAPNRRGQVADFLKPAGVTFSGTARADETIRR